jgi:hypothetical protein
MTRYITIFATLLGLAAIVWMGAGFVGNNSLALVICMIIGIGFLLGSEELRQYRNATAALDVSLRKLSRGDVTNPRTWSSELPASIQHSVQLRLEGTRVPLPAPVLTPYLVGMLVMLGLLGTFVGMVVTLQGAVAALQGSTEIDAIRSGLAEPIAGLSVAFGTSVAGVAASAMLGLCSTLSRRQRLLIIPLLDRKARNVFFEYSEAHQSQRAFKAIEDQTAALPRVSEQLQQLVQHLQTLSTSLSETLIQNQQQFQGETSEAFVKLQEETSKTFGKLQEETGTALGQLQKETGEAYSMLQKQTCEALADLGESLTENQRLQQQDTQATYSSLADSVGEALRKNMLQSSEQAVKNLQPLLQSSIDSINTSSEATHQQLASTAQNHLATINTLLETELQSLGKTVREQMGQGLDRDNAIHEKQALLLTELNQLGEKLSSGTGHLSEMGDKLNSSTADMQSLGEEFGVAMQLYSESNQNLVENLQRIESALDSSTARSDEQMGYYVAQAREIIDQSMVSQQELVEELRLLRPEKLAQAS